MQPTVLEARPPFVRFETRSEESRAASVAAGNTVYTDVDYALITPQGSKDCIERRVDEWLVMLREQVKQERFPNQWLDHYKRLYEGWKAEGEIPVQGTPLRNWPMLTPAQVKTLTGLKLLSVEDLAVANEETIARMGMGGRALKDKAVAWLKAQGSDAGKQAEEIVDLRIRLERADTQNETLAQAVAQLQAQIAILTSASAQLQAQAPQMAEASVSVSDLLDDAPSAPAAKPATRLL